MGAYFPLVFGGSAPEQRKPVGPDECGPDQCGCGCGSEPVE